MSPGLGTLLTGNPFQSQCPDGFIYQGVPKGLWGETGGHFTVDLGETGWKDLSYVRPMRTGFVVPCAPTLTCLRVLAFQFGLEIELKSFGQTQEM